MFHNRLSSRVLRWAWLAGLLIYSRASFAQDAEIPKKSSIPWASVQARYQGEPRVQEVVQQAIRFANLSVDKSDAAASRARWKNLLPVARVGARRGYRWDLQYDSTIIADQSTDDDLEFNAYVTFDLSQLLFANQEPSLLREQRVRSRDRQQLVRAIIQVYYERRRLQIERDFLGDRSTELMLRLRQAQALLDALTGGWFERKIRSCQYCG